MIVPLFSSLLFTYLLSFIREPVAVVPIEKSIEELNPI